MTKITFLGHSAVLVEGTDQTILLDPFLLNNPQYIGTLEDLPEIDIIVLTHGHEDHVGDAIKIAEKNNAIIICVVELANYLQQKNENVKFVSLNIGGAYYFPSGDIKMMRADHSSSLVNEQGIPIYLGLAAGVLIHMDDCVIYHAGDTAYFTDMQLLREEKVDVAFLPIGDTYTMGVVDAIRAANSIKAKKVVPIHYNTFTAIEQDVHLWANYMIEAKQNPEILEPWEMIIL